MRHHVLLLLPTALLGTQAGCAPPTVMSGLGTDQSYALRIVAVESKHAIVQRVTIELPRAAFVTVLEVEDGAVPRVVLRLASAEQSSTPFPAGPHELALAPTRAPRDTVKRDVVAELLGSMGKPPGESPRMVGVGSIPLEACPGANPAAPTYCPVPATEPLVTPAPIPPDRYLICIAHADALNPSELRARVRDADMHLRGRDLVAEIAAAATSGQPGARWAAVALRR
jgi:hypothetical protein